MHEGELCTLCIPARWCLLLLRHQTLCGSYHFSYYSSMHQISTYSTRIQQLGFSADSSLTMMQTSLSWQQQLYNIKFYAAVIQQYSGTAVVVIQQYSRQQYSNSAPIQQCNSIAVLHNSYIGLHRSLWHVIIMLR